MLAVAIVAIQAYTFAQNQDRYCKVAAVQYNEWREFVAKRQSKSPYLVMHIKEALLNKLLRTGFEKNNSEYQVCATINNLRDSVDVFVYASPIKWYVFSIRSEKEKPYLTLMKVKYTIFNVPNFMNQSLQKQILTAYNEYFESNLHTRKIDKVEIQNNEVLLYSAY